MGKFRNLAGQTFGMLKVLYDTGERARNGGVFWIIECISCGNLKKMHSASILHQNTACGCQNGPLHTSHGLSKHRLYGIWKNMITRCLLPGSRRYENYGGRGITVDISWIGKPNGLLSFYNWAMANGYSEDLTLERLDVNGPYSPENCTWIPMGKQAQNKENTRWVIFNGEKMCVREAHRRYGKVTYEAVLARLNKGWSPEDALLKPRVK